MQVLNKRDVSASAGVYIGRGSPWGNPFVIGKDGDRAEVIAKFRVWAEQAIGKEWLAPLIGKDLICYCAPQACHGDVLIEMIEGE
jgi:hypothetical protein